MAPLLGEIKVQNYSMFFPNSVDQPQSTWRTLAWGYTLGPWPKIYQNNPAVIKLTYKKNPPKNFIHQIIYVLDPVLNEIWIDGPRTITRDSQKTLTQQEWRDCFLKTYSCLSLKKKFIETVLLDLKKIEEQSKNTHWELHWFENETDLRAPKGLWITFTADDWTYTRAVLFTPKGVSQSFTLKSKDASAPSHLLFEQIITGMKVSDDLNSGRLWAQSQIQSIQLQKINQMTSLKERLLAWSEVQVLLSSLISVNPTALDPFFHLAGVTHQFAVDLMKAKDRVFTSQEGWINIEKPNLQALVKYAQDFASRDSPNNLSNNLTNNLSGDPRIKNIEQLLPDLNLLEQKISK